MTVMFDPALRAELTWLPVYLATEAHQHPLLSACIAVVDQGRFVRPLAPAGLDLTFMAPMSTSLAFAATDAEDLVAAQSPLVTYKESSHG